MLSLSSAAIAEKNKLSSSGAWLILLDITLANDSHVLLARNNEDIEWPTGSGDTYQKFPFDLDDMKEDKAGEHIVLNVRVSNVTRSLMPYLEADKGLVGRSVRLCIVHSDHLDLETSEVDEYFKITKTIVDVMTVTFEFSAENLFNIQFPTDRFLKNWCRFRFNYPEGTDVRCGYSEGVYLECNKTLAACRQRNNSSRFGGFPGIPGGGVYTSNA